MSDRLILLTSGLFPYRAVKTEMYEQYREHTGRAKGKERSSLLRACPAPTIMAKVVILLQLLSTFLSPAAE